MPKTIQLTDVKVIEVQILFTDTTPALNVLYALTDAQGNEYNRQWRIFKGDKVSAVSDKIAKVVERAVANVKEIEKL